MQSNKTSKNTRKIADETAAPSPEKATTGEATAKPRATKSSKPKSETGETATVKMHRKATSIATQPDAAASKAAAPKKETPAVAKIAVVEAPLPPSPLDLAPSSQVTRERVAELAHSYWLARGEEHGSSEEDWLRAERELRLGR
jgi:hypothetical protein